MLPLKKKENNKMGLFYNISDNDLLEVRNEIFLDKGIPTLKNKGFGKSPFSTAWFGKNNLGDFTYEMCRISEYSVLQSVITHISKGDTWVKIFLNIFKLSPELKSLEQLQGIDGLQYHLPPNSLTKMRLRYDDYKGPPLFYLLFLPEHKLKTFNSQRGLEKRAEELGVLIEQDMMNIDSFISRWHELHKPNLTDWEGNERN